MIHLFMGRAVEAGGEKVARGGPRVGRQAQISRHAYKMARGEQERRDQQRAPSHPPPPASASRCPSQGSFFARGGAVWAAFRLFRRRPLRPYVRASSAREISGSRWRPFEPLNTAPVLTSVGNIACP
jgi:hypothetical protein